jgi:Leucine-rich repeat (LRR) protein
MDKSTLRSKQRITFPLEIIQIIFSHTKFITQIRLKSVCKLFRQKLEIDNITETIGYVYSPKLCDQKLRSFPMLKKLKTSYNPRITDINFLTRLEVLNAEGFGCGTRNESICGISSLRELHIDYNSNVYEINHLTRLEILSANGSLYITNKHLRDLCNLTELYITDSRIQNIINLNHMTNLKILNIRGCNIVIDNTGIAKLNNLIELHVNDNEKITDLNHMTNLKILYACGYSGIGDTSISKLNLRRLHATDNSKITNLNHMNELEVLYANGLQCGINDEGIVHLSNLTELRVSDTYKIKYLGHLTRLTILHAAGKYCEIDDISIRTATKNLIVLYKNKN